MNPRTLLFLVLILAPLSGLGVDLYTPSLPAIAEYFHVQAAFAKLTITAYLIGFACGQFIFGTVSDIYGRRYTLLIGILIFLAASLAAPYVPNIYGLFFVRILQGMGAASASVISKALLTDTLKDKKLAVAMSYLSISWALGPIMAPAIGGYLQFYYNWQANFYFYALFATCLLFSVLLLLKETNKTRIALHIPVLIKNYKKLFSHSLFVGGVTMLGLGYASILIFNILGPFIVQEVLGFNAKVYGHVALLIGVTYFIGTLIARLLIQQYHSRTIILCSLAVMLFGVLVMFLFAYKLPLTLYTAVAPIILFIIADGMISPILLNSTLRLFPEMGGSASAGLGAFLTLISSSSSALISLLHATSLVPLAWAFFIVFILTLLFYFMLVHKRV